MIRNSCGPLGPITRYEEQSYQLLSLAYQEVFLKNGNSGAAAGKEERAIET